MVKKAHIVCDCCGCKVAEKKFLIYRALFSYFQMKVRWYHWSEDSCKIEYRHLCYRCMDNIQNEIKRRKEKENAAE